MKAKIIGVVLATLVVVAGILWFILGGGSSSSTDAKGDSVANVSDSSNNECSQKTLENFKGYLAKQGDSVMKWENTTALENCGVRLNKVVIDGGSKENSLHSQQVDIVKFDFSDDKQYSDIYLKGVSNGKGKNIFQSELDGTGIDGGVIKDELPPTDIHIVGDIDLTKDTMSAVVNIEQDKLLDLLFDLKMSKIKEFVSALEKNPTMDLNDEEGAKALALLSSSFLEKLEISVNDKGAMDIARKQDSSLASTKPEECSMVVSMLAPGVDNVEGMCASVVNFLSGSSKTLSVKANPQQPYAVAKIIQMSMASQVPDIANIMKELNIKISN